MLSTSLRALLRRARTLLRVALGREPLLTVDVRTRSEYLGSEYGGWAVVPDLLSRDSVVYSVGVGEDVTFDLALIRRWGMTVHAFDPTPRSIDWVAAQSLPSEFRMHGFGIASFDGEAGFRPPDNPEHVSHTMTAEPKDGEREVNLPVKRLRTVALELGHQQIDLLKMDIEGAEYAVIDDLRRSDLRPKQVLVEFHHRFPGIGPEETRAAVRKMRALGYRVFAVAPNDEEVSFVREDFVEPAPDPAST